MPEIHTLRVPVPFPEKYVNAYLVIGQMNTLIDAGINDQHSVAVLETEIERTGISIKDIHQIVITHLHTDHFGGVSELQKKLDVSVIVHERAKPLLTLGKVEFERQEQFMKQFLIHCGAFELAAKRNRPYMDRNIRNIHYVSDGDVIQAGNNEPFTVLYVPGHSQTDICLWHPSSGATVAGDSLLKVISANAFIEPPAPGETERPKTLLQYRNSLRRLKELPLGTIYPGHGDPYEGHRSLIEKRFEEQDRRCNRILEVIRESEKGRSVYEISSILFPKLRGNAVFLGLSEVMGHLDLLMEQGLVHEKHTNQHLIYVSADSISKNNRI